MFIIRTKKGETFTENQPIDNPKVAGQKKGLSWDDIPADIKVTSLQLVFPFPVRFKKKDGSLAEPFSPKLAIKDFDSYYFFNEATMPVMVQGDKVIREGVAELQAKVIAGIDYKAKILIEFRMDKFGNTSISKFPLSKLEKNIKSGIFRKEIIRRGTKR